MTTSQKVSLTVIWLIGGAVAGAYLSAIFYYLAIKTLPDTLAWDTFYQLWQSARSASEAVQHRIQLSAAWGWGVAWLGSLFWFVITHQPKRPLHGDARFASPHEVRAAKLDATHGILIGKYRGRYLIFGGEQFALVAAPTRTGKGVGVVIPNLLNWDHSVVVLDIKGENFAITSGFRAQHGQRVFCWAPFSETFRSHRWNPLSGVSRDPNFRVGDLLAIAASFYPVDQRQTSGNEAFFNEQAQSLFLALALYLLETPGLPVTLGEILRQGSGKGRPLDMHLKEILKERSNGPNALSGVCIDALNRFLSNSDNTLASIKASFEAPLLIFNNPIVDAATSHDDFDLRELRRQKMSVYLVVPPNRLPSAKRLLNIFFSQLVNLNTATLPRDDPSLRYQCLLLMDEFTAPGCIEVFKRGVAFIAGYGLRFLPITQSVNQIFEDYGKQGGQTLISNHSLKIIFPPNEIEECKQVSETLGYLTTDSASRGHSQSTMPGFIMGRTQVSENISDAKRALLLPQEIRELPSTTAIVLKEYTKPILAEKIVYHEDPVFKARLLPPIAVPTMDMATHIAMTEQRKRIITKPEEVSSIPLEAFAIDASRIPRFKGDPENPSKEEVDGIVDAFFDQLTWENTVEDTANEIAEESSATHENQLEVA